MSWKARTEYIPRVASLIAEAQSLAVLLAAKARKTVGVFASRGQLATSKTDAASWTMEVWG